MSKTRGDTIPRLAASLVRNRARALRTELLRPWYVGPQTAEAEAGRWLGVGLAVGATMVGVTLALYSTLREGRF